MHSEPRTEVALRSNGRQPFIIMSHSFIDSMFTPIIRYLQNSGYPIIFSMGRESGTNVANEIRKEQANLNTPLVKEEVLEKALNRVSQMGWGKITLTQYSFTEGGISIKIKFNPFTDECNSKTNSSCTFLRGLISGLTSEILEQDMQFCNPICQATGQETCQLQLKATMK